MAVASYPAAGPTHGSGGHPKPLLRLKSDNLLSRSPSVRLYALIPLLLAAVLAGCEFDDNAETNLLVGDTNTGSPIGSLPDDSPEVAPVPTSAPTEPEAYDVEIDNPYLPMFPGTVWIYEGDDGGLFRRDIVRILDEPRVIEGVTCTEMYQEVYRDGELSESTSHWYAQDHDGNVWMYGENSLEYEDEHAVTTEDSWLAGVGGMLGANPTGREAVQILSVAETATVPAGRFENCVEALESDPDDPEDVDTIIYGPGVGMVSEESPGGRIQLVETRRE
jgi:hypothetical protein